jgi:hypothetical protein
MRLLLQTELVFAPAYDGVEQAAGHAIGRAFAIKNIESMPRMLEGG